MTGDPIRRAELDDIPALMRLRAAVRENVLSDPARVPAEAYRAFVDRGLVRLWQEDGRILGFCAADPTDGSLWALFVDPAFEGRGIARALLPAALDDLRDAGWTEAWLSTEPGSRAERLYRRDGWTATGTTPGGDLVLRRPL